MEGSSKRIKKSISIITYCTAAQFVIGLSGCSSTQVIETSCEKPTIQESLTYECPDLPKLDNKVYTEGDVVDFLSVWISMYRQCQFKHQALSKFVNDLSKDRK